MATKKCQHWMKVLPDMSAVDAARGSGNGFFKLEEEGDAGNLS